MKARKVLETLGDCHLELMREQGRLNEGQGCEEGSVASALHDFYNEVGKREGWLKPEYATPLSKQDLVTQQKNVNAAEGVLAYWEMQFRLTKRNQESLVEIMEEIVDYEAKRGDTDLEYASELQHRRWRDFVAKYQRERITPGHEKFRIENYRQFLSSYLRLPEKEKDQDRLIVAVVTDKVLEKAGIGYKSKIHA